MGCRDGASGSGRGPRIGVHTEGHGKDGAILLWRCGLLLTRGIDARQPTPCATPCRVGMATHRPVACQPARLRMAATRRFQNLASPLQRGAQEMAPLFAQDPLHSIRSAHDDTPIRGIPSGSRAGCFLESVFSNPQVKLRARQSQSPRRPRFVPPALLQDASNRGAFDDAQIGRVAAK